MNDPAVNVRAAFRDVSLALMEWESPPFTPAWHISRAEYRRLELLRDVYRPYDPQGEVEPFDVEADWDERA